MPYSDFTSTASISLEILYMTITLHKNFWVFGSVAAALLLWFALLRAVPGCDIFSHWIRMKQRKAPLARAMSLKLPGTKQSVFSLFSKAEGPIRVSALLFFYGGETL